MADWVYFLAKILRKHGSEPPCLPIPTIFEPFTQFQQNPRKDEQPQASHGVWHAPSHAPSCPYAGKAVAETKCLNKNRQDPSLKTRARISSDRQENLIPSTMAAGAPQSASSSRNTFISPKSLALQRGHILHPPKSSLVRTLLLIPLPRALSPALCPKPGLAVRVTFSPEIPGNRLLLLTRRRFFC